jgi:hypothetical protein
MIELERQTRNAFIARVHYPTGILRNVNIGVVFDNPHETLELLTPVVDAANALAATTQRQRMKGMAALARCMRKLGFHTKPDTEEQWQALLDQSYACYLLNEESQATLETRATIWSKGIAQPLRNLQDRGLVIPVGVLFPQRKKLLEEEWNSDITTITDSGKAAPVRKPLTKLLIDIGFGMPDAAFLERCRDDLLRAVALMNDGALMWWKTIAAVHAYGQRVKRENTEREDLDFAIAQFKRGEFGPQSRFISGGSEDSLGRLLNYLERHDDRSLTAILEQDDMAPGWGECKLPVMAPSHPMLRLTPPTYINWMLGRLDGRDVAMALVLLQSHNPSFAPMSLADACVRTEKGKSLFEVHDHGTVYRLEKGRVHGMRTAVLDNDSTFVIRSILDITRNARNQLELVGAKDANRLFIVHSNGVYHACPYDTAAYHLTRKEKGWLIDYLPKLRESGLVKGSLALTKIRKSECVIEWFRTGSVTAASQKISNTTRVALKHYIPEPLLAAWNVRLIRRFQNLYICLSAARDPFLLDVSDFKTMDELQRFVTDMLQQHPASSSVLASELHLRFANLPAANSTEATAADSLMVGVDADLLAYLYCYRDLAYEAGMDQAKLDKVDPASGLAPRALIDLADLLMGRLPEHVEPSLAAAHRKAVLRVPRLRDSLAVNDITFSSQTA